MIAFNRSHRQTSQPSSSPPKKKLKIAIYILVGILVTLGIGFLITRQPTSVTCETEIFTLCSPDIAQQFTNLNSTPLWKLPIIFQQDKKIAQAQRPELIAADLHYQFLFSWIIHVKTAQILFPYLENSKTYAQLSNNSVIESDDQSLPVITFSTPEQRQQLTLEEQKSLTQLRKTLQNFTPRIRSIAVNSPTEVVISPENFGNVLFTLYDVNRQTATLQAFFRSTTMDHDYHTLDVRFENQAVIKD